MSKWKTLWNSAATLIMNSGTINSGMNKERMINMTKKVTFEELMGTKFDVVEHFGMCKKGVFFIINTIPPVEYGADCQDYQDYNVEVQTEDDVDALKLFIKSMFGINIYVSNVKEAVNAVNALDEYFRKTVPSEDWGACHVRKIPISDTFKKTYQQDVESSEQNDIKTTERLVYKILEEKEATRNSDNVLLYEVYSHILHTKGNNIDNLGFKNVILSLRELGLPHFETVRRSRQKIQHNHPELRCSALVAENRSTMQDAFTEYAVEGVDA